MSIHVESTPNPNAMKFNSDKLIFEGNNSISVMPGQTSEYGVLNELMKLDGVDNVFGFQHFITVNKKLDTEWDELIDKVEAVIVSFGY